ncbi:OmpA family protein [Pedobacter punctiformis]|uniref:OmpA family protein n=1 Tax=Pedobacter punctiformis TaxID=3004097 RepID=A0ABT4LBM6_9SPHI|nr:OmpA family protein [Pedobacter sp. HCMS5-2]MCZ4245117.1 OmpA family protein [Pedobacter sp. HCMS5-2]
MKKSLSSLFICFALWLIMVQTAKAQYVLKEADAQYELYNYIKAIDLYEQAYQKKPSLHAAERLANCYELTRNYKETESWAAIAANMAGSKPENVLLYAKALQNNSKYSEARIQYEKYTGLDKNVTATQKSMWLLSCDSAMYWMKNPKSTLIQNQKLLNTPQSDWGAVQTGNAVVFASDRGFKTDSAHQSASRPFLKFDGSKKPDPKIYGWTGNHYLRLYTQTEPGNAIAEFPLNAETNYHVGPASFTGDGKQMYFTLTRIPEKPKYVNGKLATVNVEIYGSKKGDDGKWSVPVPFPYNRVNEYSVGDPYISKDGKTLYFASNLPGGQGGTDLYYCPQTDNGSWGIPVNLKEFNTASNERCPFVDGDMAFYFSSDGWIGMGGLDIFKSTAVGGKMGKAVNMGYPVNSPQDDFAYNLSSPLQGYLSSNRMEGSGDDDIYSFKAQEPIAFKLNGIAYNKKTGEPLSHAIISLAKIGGGILKAETEADGNYKFNLDKAADYELTGEKTDYRSDVAKVTTQNLLVSTTLKQDLFLEPIVINKPIKIENIYYDFDKSNIRPDAAKELDKLVKIMQDNPTIWIELGSHTDSRGKDQYNQWLSQSRANSAVQYIIDRGIGKNRITAKGYGESQLVNRCANGVKCSEADHQANRRTEFKIVKY